MGRNYFMYKLYENGPVIEGEKYLSFLVVGEVLDDHVFDESPPPEDGKDYLVMTAKYTHHARSPGMKRSMCLFSRQRVVERLDFDFSTVSDMFADMPWQLPEVLLPPIGPWLRACASNAFPEFPTARVLFFDLIILGPYRPGGDEYLAGDFPDQHYEHSMKVQLQRVEVVPEDHTCAICLERFAGHGKEVIRTYCLHHFHRDCLVAWLLSRNSCPSCRRAVVQ